MTWRELKEKIENMPVKLQDNKVWFLDEDLELKNTSLTKCGENIYFNPRWGVAHFESDITDAEWNDPLTELILKEGDYCFFNG